MRVSCANFFVDDSREGRVDISESRDDDNEASEDDRVEVVEWRERKVGYDVWQSVVRAFVSCAADEERVVGSDSREESWSVVRCARYSTTGGSVRSSDLSRRFEESTSCRE